MKRIKLLKISLFFIITALCLTAVGLFSACFLSCRRVETDPYGITYTLNPDRKSYCVYDVGLYVREAEIAEEYKGLPVTKIRSGACYDRVFMGEGTGRYLDLITIPQSIKIIEENAFGGRGYVKKIIYGGSVSDWLKISFGSSPIDGGTEIYIEDELLIELNVPDGIEEINRNAFAGYSYLKVLNVPDGVKKINVGAFANCTLLKEVNLGSGIEFLADGVFSGCRSLRTANFKAVSVLSSEDFAYGGALYGCNELENISFGGNINIGNGAFKDNKSLKSFLADGDLCAGDSAFEGCVNLAQLSFDGLNEAGKKSFKDCLSLNEINLSESGLTEISELAFFGCSGLSEIVLPNVIERIGVSAFSGCKNITEITFPDKLKEVCSGAFNYCELLETVNWNCIDCVYEHELTNSSIYIGSVLKTVKFGAQVTRIPEFAFRSCRDLQSVSLSSVLREIGDSAFDLCSRLSDIEIPESVERIGKRAFSDCPLKQISVSSNLTEIGDSAFSGCGDVERITVDASNVNYSFVGNCLVSVRDNKLIKGLSDCVIPDGITAIGYGAFANCTLLTNIVIPDSVTAIEDLAFSNTSITEITLPDGVTVIKYGLFKECENLLSVNLGKFVSNIEVSVFYLSGIKKIIIPDSVTEIEMCAFEKCYYLSEVDLGAGVKSISTWAFGDCDSLKRITIPASMEIIDGAFYNCDNLEMVYFEITEGWSSKIFDDTIGEWIDCEVPYEEFENPETAAKRVKGNHYSGEFIRR